MEYKLTIQELIDQIELRMETIENEFLSETKQSMQKSSQDFGRYVELSRLLGFINCKRDVIG